MSTKALISLFLIPLFLGKLFIVDASAINLLSHGSISFVKQYCQKKQSASHVHNTYDFEQTVDARDTIIKIGSFCTPQFNFNVFSWSFNNSEVINAEDVLFTSRLSYLYLDSHSPPPKLV
ncbi:MAG: hypothetical protein R3218_07155 [Christiangramia sp.]|nr:hypothetical protein [Christiangramia sp.]